MDVESKPSVSILMINKNHGHYLTKTIKSYLSQTWANLDIIVVDGGSIDNSVDILKKFTKVKVYSEKDSSGSEAYIKCLNLCKSELVMFATSNDLLVDIDFIERAVALFVRNRDLSCVFGKVLNLLENDSPGDVVYPHNLINHFGEPRQNFKNWLINSDSFHECAALFNKNAVLTSLGDLGRYSLPLNQLKIDLFLELRYGFFSNGFKAKFIDANVVAIRNHLDRVSVESRPHFLRHLNYYSEQISDFRINFIRKHNYNFISPYNDKKDPLGVLDSSIFSLLIIRHLIFVHFKSSVKKLLHYKS